MRQPAANTTGGVDHYSSSQPGQPWRSPAGFQRYDGAGVALPSFRPELIAAERAEPVGQDCILRADFQSAFHSVRFLASRPIENRPAGYNPSLQAGIGFPSGGGPASTSFTP